MQLKGTRINIVTNKINIMKLNRYLHHTWLQGESQMEKV
jgi:hypothetical protein